LQDDMYITRKKLSGPFTGRKIRIYGGLRRSAVLLGTGGKRGMGTGGRQIGLSMDVLWRAVEQDPRW